MPHFVRIPAEDTENYNLPWFVQGQDVDFDNGSTYINVDNIVAIDTDEPLGNDFPRVRIALASKANVIIYFASKKARKSFLAAIGVVQ